MTGPYVELDGKVRKGANSLNCTIDVIGMTDVRGMKTAVVKVNTRGIEDRKVISRETR